VIIESVAPDSAALRAGLSPGDVIVQLGNQRVSGIRDYQLVTAKIPKGVPVLIRFLRQGQFIFRTIEIAP